MCCLSRGTALALFSALLQMQVNRSKHGIPAPEEACRVGDELRRDNMSPTILFSDDEPRLSDGRPRTGEWEPVV